jgi:hypothetical protein
MALSSTLVATEGPEEPPPGPSSVQALVGLPYREIWALDFEFVTANGEQPVPVCMVARELRSGRASGAALARRAAGPA